MNSIKEIYANKMIIGSRDDFGSLIDIIQSNDPTLKINNTDPYPIYTYGTTSPGDTPDTSWYAGSVITFMFDGAENAWINTNQFILRI